MAFQRRRSPLKDSLEDGRNSRANSDQRVSRLEFFWRSFHRQNIFSFLIIFTLCNIVHVLYYCHNIVELYCDIIAFIAIVMF